MRVEKVWERREEFLKLNPAGDVPVLVEPDGTVLSGSAAICEFLDETYPNEAMLGADAVSRAETGASSPGSTTSFTTRSRGTCSRKNS